MQDKNFLPVWIGSVVLLGATIVLGQISTRRVPERLAYPLSQISTEIDGWRAVGDRQLDPGSLRSLDPTSYLSRVYQRDGLQLELFVAFYAQQRAGESMHSPKHCLPGAGWEIMQRDLVPIAGTGTTPKLLNKFLIQNDGQKLVLFYWYQSHDRVTADEYAGKVLLARDTLLTGHTAGSIVRVSLPDTPGSTEKGEAFCSKVMPQVQRCLGYSPDVEKVSALRSLER